MTRRRWWLLGAGLVLVWAIIAAVLLARAALDLREGRDDAEAARDALTAASLVDGTALPQLRSARDNFGSAHAATGNPIVAPLRLLPVVGRQLRSVHALSGAAHAVTAAGVVAAARAHEVLENPQGGGPARVEQVRALSEAVSTAARTVEQVTDLGPRLGLVGPLADARNQLAAQLLDARMTLTDASAGAAAGLRFLEGPRRYLLVAANNAEMRAGSGMWLSGGVLSTAAGRLELGTMAPLYDTTGNLDGRVPILDADLAARWGDRHPEGDWRRLMFSPRMPASGALAVAMWQAAGQPPVDGVIVVDPVGLAAVVRATGPVQVDDRTITADDVVPELLKGQYLRFGADGQLDERRDALEEVAGAAFAALDAGEWSPTELAAELGKAVGGRHLLAYSTDGVEQRGWVAAGAAGDLQADSLLVSVLNRGVNKLDPYLRTGAELETRPVGDGTEVTVRLSLANEAPEGLPPYVAGGPASGEWAPREYVGLVTVNVPGAASDVRVLEGGFDSVAGPDGPTQVVAAELRLLAGRSREVTVRFRLPGRHGRLAVEPSARVPGIFWEHGGKSWQDSGRRMAKW